MEKLWLALISLSDDIVPVIVTHVFKAFRALFKLSQRSAESNETAMKTLLGVMLSKGIESPSELCKRKCMEIVVALIKGVSASSIDQELLGPLIETCILSVGSF